MFTLTFSYVNNEARTNIPLVDEYGNEITLQVDAVKKSDTYYHPEVIAFCKAQGNDTRIRRIT
jgi:hypothetical protein